MGGGGWRPEFARWAPGEDPPLVKGLARVLLVLLSLAIGCGLLELGLTLAYRAAHGPGPWREAAGVGSPYVHFAAPGRGDINNLSIRRDTPTARQAPAGTLRVLSYGDSVAQGYQLSHAQTYAHLLEEQLNASAPPRVEILNMFRGHSPSIHAFHLRSDVPRLLPDAVLLEIELLNDVSDEVFVETQGRDEFGLPLELVRARYLLGLGGHLLPSSRGGSSFWKRTLLYGRLSRWRGRRLSRRTDDAVLGPLADTAYYATSSERHLLTEAALGRAFDRLFESVAGIQRYLEAREVAFLLVIMPSRDVYEEGRFAVGASRLLRRAQQRASDLDIPTLSLWGALGEAGGALLYMDFCHPTAAGNAAIAETLRQPVRELLGQPR